jgi:hypothetical protein
LIVSLHPLRGSPAVRQRHAVQGKSAVASDLVSDTVGCATLTPDGQGARSRGAPPDVEIAPEWDAFLASVKRPAAQERISNLMRQGFHKPGEVETWDTDQVSKRTSRSWLELL